MTKSERDMFYNKQTKKWEKKLSVKIFEIWEKNWCYGFKGKSLVLFWTILTGFCINFELKKKTIKKIPRSKNQKAYLFYVFIMLEQIYYNESNLDDEGNFITDIAKDNAVIKKVSGQHRISC